MIINSNVNAGCPVKAKCGVSFEGYVRVIESSTLVDRPLINQYKVKSRRVLKGQKIT